LSLQLRLVKQAKLQRFQKKTYRNRQGKILRYWDEFTAGQKTSSQLLKACSRVYGPTFGVAQHNRTPSGAKSQQSGWQHNIGYKVQTRSLFTRGQVGRQVGRVG